MHTRADSAGPGRGLVARPGLPPTKPQDDLSTWISDSPTLPVVAETDVTVNRMLVVVLAGKVIVVAEPSLFRDGTFTVLPSLKVSVPPVT